MTKALEDHNVEQMQLCLQSHSASAITQYISVKSEARPIAMAKLPTINRITRVTVSASIKSSGGPVVVGAISNSTSEAIALRTRASVELFLETNSQTVDGPPSSLSAVALRQLVTDVESVSCTSSYICCPWSLNA